VVPLVHARLVALRRRDREDDLDLASGQLARQLEAERFEDAEHPTVLREHLGHDSLDPLTAGALGELLDEPRADAATLVLVCDRERSLGQRRVAEPDVVRDRDDTLTTVLGERADQGSALGPVRVDDLLHEVGPERREPMEAQVEAPLRERTEELENLVGVRAGRRAEAQRLAVAEDDVYDIAAHTADSRGYAARSTTSIAVPRPERERSVSSPSIAFARRRMFASP
jgi:hypothetical protein